MDIKTQLNESVKDAMKSGDEVRKRTLRMVLAAVKQNEVDKQISLDELAVVGLIQKEIKNRREAIEEATKDKSIGGIPSKSHARRRITRPRTSCDCGDRSIRA
jgi:uncharacterized protein YqeY